MNLPPGGNLPMCILPNEKHALQQFVLEPTAANGHAITLDDFPRSLERIILKATAHSADDRYQSMSEFILDLDKYTRGEWISPLGRIRLGRYAYFLRERHPKIVYGVPIALGVCLSLWLAMMLPTWLDSKRREYNDRLIRLESAVEAIKSAAMDSSNCRRNNAKPTNACALNWPLPIMR